MRDLNKKRRPEPPRRLTDLTDSSAVFKDTQLSQETRLKLAFNRYELTMLEASKITGVERGNVCRYVDKLRLKDFIEFKRFRKCIVSKRNGVQAYSLKFKLSITDLNR